MNSFPRVTRLLHALRPFKGGSHQTLQHMEKQMSAEGSRGDQHLPDELLWFTVVSVEPPQQNGEVLVSAILRSQLHGSLLQNQLLSHGHAFPQAHSLPSKHTFAIVMGVC